MSFSNQASYIVLALSLVFNFGKAQPEETLAPASTPMFITGLALMIGIPTALYWYENYYKIDHTTVSLLTARYKKDHTKAENLINALTTTSDLETTILKLYPYFPYPYLTCHFALNELLSHFRYYQKAFTRKIKQHKLTDPLILPTVTTLLENLSQLLYRVENTDGYKNEHSSGSRFEHCPVCFHE